MKRTLNRKLIVVLFFTFIFGFLFLNIVYSSVDYLFFENRMPVERLDFNKEVILSGEYFSILDDHLADRFIFREKLLALGTYMNLRVLDRPIVNDLYIGDDMILSIWEDWQIPYPKEEIEYMTEGYGELSKSLKKLSSDFIYVGVPEHSSIHSEYYPKHFYNKGKEWLEIEEDFFEKLDDANVTNIKMRNFFKENPQNYYTSTDHHFSYYGAIKTYEEIIKKINSISDFNLVYDDLEVKKLDEDFKGSYSRKLFNMDSFKDETLIYDVDFDFVRKDNGEKTESKLFYLDRKIEDKYYGYDIYMGGDMGLTHIDTNRQDLPNILLYGDSFTNPVETLLVRNSNNFWSVDFRHYKDHDLLELVNELEPDFVICLRDNLMYNLEENNGILK